VLRPVPEVGSTASNYEIVARLATGGMAEIFLARSMSAAGVRRHVVLKRILSHKASDAEFLRMFLDEARLASQLQHPNIAQVYDVGMLGDSLFFTMEYVHGETVLALTQRAHASRRQLPLATVLTIVAGAAAGLHHAHERLGIDGRPFNIVHRDVSPSNLMVSYEGGVKVVDFGIAKAEHRATETQSGAIKGKISYLSPEQCRGAELDRRSDLFALGIVLWEMLTTERLYKKTSVYDIMASILEDTVPPPSTLRPDISPEIDGIVLRLLAKNPDDRFQSGEQLNDAIENAAVGIGSALSAVAVSRVMRELFGRRSEPWIERQARDRDPEVITLTSQPIPHDHPLPIELIATTLMPTLGPDAMPEPPKTPVPTDEPPPRLPSLPVFASAETSRPTAELGRNKRRIPRTLWIVGPSILSGVIGAAILYRSSSQTAAPQVAIELDAGADGVVSPGGAEVVATAPAPLDAGEPAAPAVVAVDPRDYANTKPATRESIAVPRHHPVRALTIEELVQRQRYEDAVSSCVARGVGASASCMTAACQAHDASHARKWFASLPQAEQPAAIGVCKDAGIVLDPPRPRPISVPADDCNRDPLACQH
jgi:serine/threonine protein kinase